MNGVLIYVYCIRVNVPYVGVAHCIGIFYQTVHPLLQFPYYYVYFLSFIFSPLSLQKQASTTVPKSSTSTLTSESYGSGRPVPIKEGSLNKKSHGSLRAEWRKKYLVLTQSEITYYPNLQDYMNMTHGKSFKLQHITIRNPGQRISSITRAAATMSPNNMSGSEFTDSITVGSSVIGDQSDRSNSPSPPPGPLTSSLDVSYNSTASGLSNIRIMGPDTHEYRYDEREYRSPVSPGGDDFNSSDHLEDLGSYGGPRSIRYEGTVNGGRGHTRNGSLDDNSMLKQLRSGGGLVVTVMFEFEFIVFQRHSLLYGGLVRGVRSSHCLPFNALTT